MRVTCELYGPFRDPVGTKSLEREVAADATVRDVFAALADDYPALGDDLFDDGTFADSVIVLRNDRNVAHQCGAETPVADGDVLSAAPAVEGG
ncbi:ubiquitin-like small modifier protein 1 [Halopiger xanaduensis]|uniref:ThiamineS protein n=1 Tax=Halopiger xanaduensis (strain DSM 18323 / JCM 14033 / SH-6) TaxID=797210 RepID=F8D3T3_HALXS|nr:ubiquitin-like small modifier protein 1 [Halopiger xanaduensis]AEH38586.1 thiamineS protein [Halopiger xanaduensis SH-6]